MTQQVRCKSEPVALNQYRTKKLQYEKEIFKFVSTCIVCGSVCINDFPDEETRK